MSEIPEYVDLSTLAEVGNGGNKIPPGEYVGRMSNLIPKLSKSAQKPMLEAHFEITEGEHAGETSRTWYSLAGTVSPKNGKAYFPGLMELNKSAHAIGSPFPGQSKFPTDPALAGKLVASTFNKKKLKLEVYEEPDRQDPDKIRTKIRIVGLAVPGGIKTVDEALSEFA